MTFTRAALLSLLLASSQVPSPVLGDEPRTHFYRVHVKNDEEYSRAFSLAHNVILSKRDEYVDIVAPASAAAALRKEGLKVAMVQEDMIEKFNRTRQKSGYGAYHSDEEMGALLRGLEAAHPDLMRVETFGASWQTLAGEAQRPLLAVKIARNVNRPEDTRPEVLYFAGVHAREIATTEVLLQFIQHLLDKRLSDPTVAYILGNRQLWIIPNLNPDGREYVFQRDIWWRKNRRRIGAAGPTGVDLNRNFAYQWGDLEEVNGSSSDPRSGTYRGETPFSEPETRALRDFVLGHEFISSLSFHSYGEYVIMPFGFTSDAVPHQRAYHELAGEVARALRYPFGNVASMVGYYSNGRHDDWLYCPEGGKKRTLALEVELGRTFFPAEDELPALYDLTLPACVELALVSGGYPEVEVVPNAPADQGALTLVVRNRGMLPVRNLQVSVVRDGKPPFTLFPTPFPELGGGLAGNGPRSTRITASWPQLASAPGPLKVRLDFEDPRSASRHVPLQVTAD